MQVQSTNSFSTNRLKLLIYGQPGVGKTSLAATLKEPTLIISAEAGLLSLASHNIDALDITVDKEGKPLPKEKRASQLGQAFEYVCKPEVRSKYKWLFIDSLTEIAQNLTEALAEVYTDPKDTIKMWGEYNKKARSLIKTFRDLPYYNVVFTALEIVEEDENKRRFTRPDMQGGIGKKLAGYFDEVLYLHIGEDDARQLLTQPHSNVQAKDRSGKLLQIEEPNLQAIADKIRGTKPKAK